MPESLVPIFMPPAKLFANIFYGIHLGDLQPVQDVSKLAYPVLIIHGEADSRTPVSQGRKVYQAAPPGSELWILPGVEHVKAFEVQPDEYVRRVSSYFDSRLE